jgi:hypothetical protein
MNICFPLDRSSHMNKVLVRALALVQFDLLDSGLPKLTRDVHLIMHLTQTTQAEMSQGPGYNRQGNGETSNGVNSGSKIEGGGTMSGSVSGEPEFGQSIVPMGDPQKSPVDTILRVNQHVSKAFCEWLLKKF